MAATPVGAGWLPVALEVRWSFRSTASPSPRNVAKRKVICSNEDDLYMHHVRWGFEAYAPALHALEGVWGKHSVVARWTPRSDTPVEEAV